jgi:hypothetical protein
VGVGVADGVGEGDTDGGAVNGIPGIGVAGEALGEGVAVTGGFVPAGAGGLT